MDQSINRPPYGVIVILMIGAFISFLNNTLLNVALPSIMSDLNVGPATVQWLSTGFMLASGILIPTTAFLIQKYSVRHLFLAAIGLFTIGTTSCWSGPCFSSFISGKVITSGRFGCFVPLINECHASQFPNRKTGTSDGDFWSYLNVCPCNWTNSVRLDC